MFCVILTGGSNIHSHFIDKNKVDKMIRTQNRSFMDEFTLFFSTWSEYSILHETKVKSVVVDSIGFTYRPKNYDLVYQDQNMPCLNYKVGLGIRIM